MSKGIIKLNPFYKYFGYIILELCVYMLNALYIWLLKG